jgi:hypothetical protein
MKPFENEKDRCIQRSDLKDMLVPTTHGYMEFWTPRVYRWNTRKSSEWTILIWCPEVKRRRKWVGAYSIDFDFIKIDRGNNGL